MSLTDYGWDASWQERFAPLEGRGLRPGRVSLLQRGLYQLVTGEGEVDAVVAGRMHHQAREGEDLPAIGDWVGYEPRAQGPAVIRSVLPRRTRLARAGAGKKTREQVVAANVDTVFVIMGLDGDYNLRRMERFLSMVWESGANPVVLLNKMDLVTPEEARHRFAAADQAAPGVPVHLLSAKHGRQLEEITHYLEPGRTIALVGSSGAGKSTLINRLLGAEKLATREVRASDERGQHTTTHRELVQLPEGALLIDNPGIRELQLWEAQEGVAETFEDVEDLAGDCRFRDCRHEGEPGCAVLAAVEAGELPEERLASYRSLRKELAHLEQRQDVGARLAEKRKWKAIHGEMKRFRKGPEKE